MELIKRSIHMNKLKCRSNVQLTLDNDFNVPDIKPDISRVIKEQGDVVIGEMKIVNGKAVLRGNLDFSMLYVAEDDRRPVHSMMGQLPFEEIINMDEACADDNVSIYWALDDLRVEVINSRKISVKAIVSFEFTAEDMYDQETAVGVTSDEKLFCRNKKMNITQMNLCKKDTFRIKDEIRIPTGKPNILEMLYNEMWLQGIETRLLDNQISLKGELHIFFLYVGGDEDQQLQYYDTELPFSGMIDCNGCDDSMISDIMINIHNKDLQLRTDEDGEERILDVEIVLELNMKVYREEELDILSDVYSTAKDIKPTYKDAYYESLIMKNNSKDRVVDKIRVEEGQPRVLQICNSSGDVRIDEKTVVPNGIQVDGIIDVRIMYITEDDTKPLGAVKGVIPFSQLIEMKDIKEDSIFNIVPGLDQLSVVMLDGEEIEVKATISLNTVAFDKIKEPVIEELEISDLNLDAIQEMPGLIGYVAKAEDTLWDIAKQFYTTVENIMELNGMESENIRQGDKLLLMKQIDLG